MYRHANVRCTWIALVAPCANISPPCRIAIGLMHTEAPAGFQQLLPAHCKLHFSAFLAASYSNLSAELLLTKPSISISTLCNWLKKFHVSYKPWSIPRWTRMSQKANGKIKVRFVWKTVSSLPWKSKIEQPPLCLRRPATLEWHRPMQSHPDEDKCNPSHLGVSSFQAKCCVCELDKWTKIKQGYRKLARRCRKNRHIRVPKISQAQADLTPAIRLYRQISTIQACSSH